MGSKLTDAASELQNVLNKINMEPVRKSKRNFLKLLILFIAIFLPWIIGITYIKQTSVKQQRTEVKFVNYKRDTVPKVNHSKFAVLQQDFKTPEEVTQACLSCHNTTDQEIMQTSHWKWERDYVTETGDTIKLGKKNILNNFCIGISSNQPRCTSCHIGYGWKDNTFDFTDNTKIDCLICHDKTGTYKKFPSGAGYPVTKKLFSVEKLFTNPIMNTLPHMWENRVVKIAVPAILPVVVATM